MPIIPFNNLASVGIVKDFPAHDLPPEAWSAGQNIRFYNNRVEKLLGHQAVYDPPSIIPYWLLGVQTSTDYFWVYPGLTKVYCTDGTTHFNITRQSGGLDVDYAATADGKWNGGVLGGVPILNNGIDAPQMWSPVTGGTRLQALTNWPAATTAKCIRPAFRNFLFAMDLTESGTRYPSVLRWSHPADPGAVPSSWDYTDPSKDAGRVPIGDTPGDLLDYVQMGNVGVLYKEDSGYLIQYVGGQDIFSVRQLPFQINLLGRHCAVPFSEGHFVATADDCVVHNGQSVRSILSDRIRSAVADSIDQTYKQRSFVIPNYAKSEIWFCFPTTGSTAGLADTTVIWNWRTGALSYREVANLSFGTLGIVDATISSNTWDADTASWDTDSTIWDERNFNATFTSMLLANASSSPKLYLGDATNQFAGANMTAYVERTGLGIVGRNRDGSLRADPNSIKHVKRVIPRIQSSGSVNIYVGYQDNEDSAVAWSGPFAFDTATDTEIQCDVVGRYIAIKFESTTNIDWHLSSYLLDIEIVGKY